MPTLDIGAWSFWFPYSPDTTAVYPSFLDALNAYLTGLSSLSALSHIYLNKVKPVTVNNVKIPVTYPFMVISSNFDQTQEYNTSPDYWENQPIQFTVMSRDDGEAYSLARSAAAALMPKKADGSLFDKLLFLDGYEMARFPGKLRGPLEQPGQGQGQMPVWSVVFMVDFLLGRSMGT